MFRKYGIFLLQIRPCIHRRSFHQIRNDCFRKQNQPGFREEKLVQDCIIFIRNKTGVVVSEEESNKTLKNVP